MRKPLVDNEILKDTELEEIKERCDKANPAPWYIYNNGLDGNILDNNNQYVFGGEAGEGYIELNDPNAIFIVHARSDIPDLITTIKTHKSSYLLALKNIQKLLDDVIALEKAVEESTAERDLLAHIFAKYSAVLNKPKALHNKDWWIERVKAIRRDKGKHSECFEELTGDI